METDNKKTIPQIQELSENELMHVSGGFWPAVILAVILTGCATIPNKGHDN